MATFERFDICLAHQALENDWNKGGWLRERPSNLRRMEATHVQLERMQFRAGMGEGGTFDALEDNAKEIYVIAVVRFGLAPLVERDDELGTWIRREMAPAWALVRFPHFATGAKA